MDFLNSLADSMLTNWHVWLVTIVLIVAAVIDGIQLKVPNWLTFPMIISGWLFSIGSYVVPVTVPSSRLLSTRTSSPVGSCSRRTSAVSSAAP